MHLKSRKRWSVAETKNGGVGGKRWSCIPMKVNHEWASCLSQMYLNQTIRVTTRTSGSWKTVRYSQSQRQVRAATLHLTIHIIRVCKLRKKIITPSVKYFEHATSVFVYLYFSKLYTYNTAVGLCLQNTTCTKIEIWKEYRHGNVVFPNPTADHLTPLGDSSLWSRPAYRI